MCVGVAVLSELCGHCYATYIIMLMHELPVLCSGIPMHRHHAMNSAAVLLYAFTSGELKCQAHKLQHLLK